MKQLDYPLSLGPKIHLRPTEPGDIEATHLLNLAPPVPRDMYLWLYFDNPFREGRPPGWVVVHDEFGIVGKIWWIWWPMIFRGAPIPAVQSGDLFVDTRLRGMGAGVGIVRHQFEVFPEGLVVGSSANPNSMGFWRKFGGFTVGLGNVRFQRFVSPGGALRGLTSGIPVVRDVVGRMIGKTGPRDSGPKASSGKGWRLANLSDPALLAFLERTERLADVSMRRDETLLRWRYGPRALHGPRLLLTDGTKGINGYLAMQIRTRAERLGLRVAEVIDFVVDFGDAAARHAVVAASLAWGRAHGAHVVEWRGTHPAVPTLFAGGGWMRRASEINPFVCYSQRTDELDLRSRAFHMVLAEGDGAIR